MIKRVYLEITNSCNLNCPFCSASKGTSFMSLDEIDNYTTQIKEVTNFIYLHVLGEPTLHPDFEEILNILDSKDLNLQLVTNGTLLYKYKNILNHKCLRKLSISLHSINNIDVDDEYFNVINELIENNKVNIELRFYDRNNFDKKLNDYLDYLYKTYDVKTTVKNNSFLLKENTYIFFQELFNWPSLDNDYIGNQGKCLGATSQIAILHNGDVTCCCLDPKGINTFGNIKKNALTSILNSEQYLNIINDFKQRKLNLKLCQHCDYRLRFDHNNN